MSKMSKIVLSIIVVFVVAVGVSYGISQRNTEPTAVTKKTIKVGVLGDLSGDYVSFFRGIPRGVALAVEDIKGEANMELIIEDQKSCDPKETLTIMSKFIEIDKVDMIVGGSCSNTTLVAAPVAEKAKVIMISPSSSALSVSEAGDYIFRTYISDVLRAKEAARLAYALGKRRMAIIIDVSNDATFELARGAKEEFLKLAEVVEEQEVTKTDTDFRTQLAKIKAAEPDVLFMSITGPKQNALIAKQTRELGLDIQLLVPGETIEDPIVVEVAGDAVEGLIYVIPGNPPESSAYQGLKRRYVEEYGETDIPSFVTEAYDAVMLGVKAISASDGTREDIKDKLYEVSKTYQGVSGSVEFDANGDVEKSVTFKTIKDGQFVPYER